MFTKGNVPKKSTKKVVKKVNPMEGIATKGDPLSNFDKMIASKSKKTAPKGKVTIPKGKGPVAKSTPKQKGLKNIKAIMMGSMGKC